MGVPGSVNPLLASASTQYKIERSLRFNRSDSAYLTRTPSSSGSQTTFTLSVWLKLGNQSTGADSFIWSSADAYAGNANSFLWKTFDGSYCLIYDGGSGYYVRTVPLFRDSSAWFHVVLSVDTTQATADNRVRIYVNGSQITSLSSPTYPAQNYAAGVNTSAFPAYLGALNVGGSMVRFFEGYLADAHFIDGQALTPSSFAETDTATGQWIPKAYSGSYGVNGFQLKFADNSAATAAALGKDTSGNGNNLTPNNFSAGVLGTPTIYTPPTGFSVWADTFGTGVGSITYSDGNKSGTASATSEKTVLTSSAKSSGKWYIEFVRSGVFDSADEVWGLAANNAAFPGSAGTNGIGCAYTRSVFNSLGSGTSATPSIPFFTSGSVCQLAVDFDSKKVWWGVDNVWSSSGNPSTGSNPTFSAWSGTPTWYAAQRLYYTNNKSSINFGNATALIQTDSYVDTPVSYGLDTGLGGEVRGNYCTLNPIDQLGSNAFSNGNLDVQTDLGTATSVCATFAVTSGKWYWEVRNDNGSAAMIGIADYGQPLTARRWNSDGAWFYYAYQGDKYFNSTPSAYGAAYTTGDIIGIALDMDSGSVTFYKNGASQGVAFSSGLAGKLIGPCLGNGTSSFGMIYKCNFGQRAFVYGAPSGYKCLCSANLPEVIIANGKKEFNAVLYTGNSSARSITGFGFSPDFLWIKARSATHDSGVLDAVRGAGKFFYSQLDTAEQSYPEDNTSFDSDGFSLGTGTGTITNQSGTTYIAWGWNAGSTTASNASGSISSSVRANPASGFSIVTYTGNGSAGATVGHGLGAAPQMIIIKSRSAQSGWPVYHSSAGNTRFFYLDNDGAGSANSTAWNNTSPSSSVFTLGTGTLMNTSGHNYVAYCFAPVSGYLSIGEYTGNGSNDGTFVYTGFKPAFVIRKMIETTGSWEITDAIRDPANVASRYLYADIGLAESSFANMDLLSNGFKSRTTATGLNSSGSRYLYMAFAESPFKYARAR